MIVVDSEHNVELLIKDLTEEKGFITVDTEFIREVSKVPLLCLLQIATQKESYVVDPLSVDLNVLKPFFADNNLIKVFHDANQDIEILQIYGFEVNNIYDTQLYEMILSTKESISYQMIVSEYTHVKLIKRYGLSDWSKRPLSKRQLNYAVEDVTYLRSVYKKQQSKLKRLHREHWLDDETSIFKEHHLLENSLHESCYPLLYKLLGWREKKAKEKNIDPSLIASNNMIKSICKNGQEYVQKLKNSRNLLGDKEFVDYAESIAGEYLKEKIREERNPIVDLLKTLLVIKSNQYNVAPKIIASVKDLYKFVSGDLTVKFLKGWRKEIFGQCAIDLLDSKIKIGVKDNKIYLWTINDKGK